MISGGAAVAASVSGLEDASRLDSGHPFAARRRRSGQGQKWSVAGADTVNFGL